MIDGVFLKDSDLEELNLAIILLFLILIYLFGLRRISTLLTVTMFGGKSTFVLLGIMLLLDYFLSESDN